LRALESGAIWANALDVEAPNRCVSLLGSARGVFSERSNAALAVATRPLPKLKRVLWHLLGGTRGGPTRIRIIVLLRDRPLNTNQITRSLGIDYKTAEHHLRVLRENLIVSPSGDKYGAVFFLTKDMEESMSEFDIIVAKTQPPPPVKEATE
jgi:DNA-binding transcriptional ArsR family regulator